MKMTPSRTLTSIALLSVSALALAGCAEDNGKKARSFSQSSAEDVTVDTAVNAINGIYDEVSGVRASEAGCTADGSEGCGVILASAVRRQYACQSNGTELSGTTTLTFSHASCDLNSAGRSVAASQSTTLSINGVSVTANTSAHQDYDGTAYLGGATLTNVGGTSLLYGVQGLRRLIVENDELAGDFSVKSTSSLSSTGGLLRASRRIQSGALRVADNRKRFVATVQLSNLGWSSGCCFPTSGTLDMSFSGSVSGSRKVTMTGCGSFRVENAGTVTEGRFLTCGI